METRKKNRKKGIDLGDTVKNKFNELEKHCRKNTRT
jgi:hypothetical protein